MANTKDQFKMSHKAAFHQGLHCFLILKQPSGTEEHYNLETFTSDPLSYKMCDSILIVSTYIGKSIKGLNTCVWVLDGSISRNAQYGPQ